MPKSPKTCPFCDLIRGAGEVSMCYEDSEVVAFLDIQPVNPGHLLVVPRAHHESLQDIPHALSMHLFEVAMELAPVIKQVAAADGLNLVVNSGAAAGQDVFHYHVHVIPRRAGDGFDVPLPFPGSGMPDRTVLDATAARIISALRDPVAVRKRVERRTSVTDRRAPSSHK
jgi:histidine triad (HIT) family protein